MRLFFALDIEPKDAAIIEQWRTTHLDETALADNFKVISPANYHITLAFIGTVNDTLESVLINEAKVIAKKLKKISAIGEQTKPPMLTLDQLGLFKKAKVLYLANTTIPAWLSKLALDLTNSAAQLGLTMEGRPYLPHVSLYRKATSLIPHNNDVNISLNIKSFSLYRSTVSNEGVNYFAIHNWKI
jgi:2'-5' RNA ligase